MPNLHVRSPRAAVGPNPEQGAVLGSRCAAAAADAAPRARARQVIKLMQSFKSKEFVKEAFAWRHYYWRAPCNVARRERCLV